MKLSDLKEQCDRSDHRAVYEFLLGTPVVSGKSFRSPIRRGDRNPSFNVFRSRSGRWLWKDFAYGEGDVYDLVRIKYGCDFPRAVRIVAERLGIQEDSLPLPPAKGMVQLFKKLVVPETSKTDCWYENAGIHRLELAVNWARRHELHLELFDQFDWVPIEWGVVSKNEQQRVYTPSLEQPMFAIHIEDHIKFYRPGGDRPKYVGNTTTEDIYGLKWLVYDERPTLLVGGHKDALLLLTHANHLVKPITMNSESIMIPHEQMDVIMERSSELYICYDNDEAGEAGVAKLIEAYPFIKQVKLPHAFNVNDVADIVTRHGSITLTNTLANKLQFL